MSLFVFSVSVSVVLIGIIYAIARSRLGMPGVCLFTGSTTVLCLFLGLPYFFFHSLGSFLLALGCAGFSCRPKTVVVGSVVVMIASCGLMLSTSLGELRKLQNHRAQYPLVSVAGRLKYEERVADQGSPPPVLGGEVEQRLSKAESLENTGYRSYMLSRLHDRTLDDFVMAQGFGSARMMGARFGQVELPKAKPVPLPKSPESDPDYPSAEEPIDPFAPPPKVEQIRPSQNSLLSLHDGGLEDFFNGDRMGYIKDRDHVAGFLPHQFLTMPSFANKQSYNNQWQVVMLQLVSLLKHEKPRCHVSPNLPQMDQLKDAPTRPLNGFEQRAIERLRVTEDLVVEEKLNRIRLMGSIRAAKNCLDCHHVRRGELLGAFSYELVPLSPAAMPKAEDDPLGEPSS